MSKKKGSGHFDALKTMRDELAKREADEKARAAEALAQSKKSAARVQQEPRGAKQDYTRAATSGVVDEEDAYRRLVAGTTPLEGRERRVPRAEGAEARALTLSTHAEDGARERFHAIVDDNIKFEASRNGNRVEASRRGLGADVKKRLREGGYPIDTSLDLHGAKAADAKERLREFLRGCSARKERCIAVVHGKGTHSAGGVPILQQEVFDWLTGELRGYVDATITAPVSQGGDGTTLVLLTRK